MNGIQGHFRHRLGAFELNADFNLPAKGISALTGPSGSGKTTLLRCIAGLENAPEGECRVGGEVWQESGAGVFVPPHRREVGCVFQDANLFPHLSVRGNLEYGWRRIAARDRKIHFDQAVEMMGVEHLLERTPRNLSGGEQQRVAIARALLTSPRLLLLDEPLGSLDLETKRAIHPYLEHLHRELAIPVLYVSHDPHEIARIADHLALMEKGKIVASGSMTEIMTRLDLSLARSEQALAVIEAEVAEHDDGFALTMIRFSGGTLTIPRLSEPIGARVRARILARDVSLALTHHTDSSILNIFPARVIEKGEDGEGHALVRLDASGTMLLARITKKSAHLLGLKPSMEVYVQVKSVAVMRN